MKAPNDKTYYSLYKVSLITFHIEDKLQVLLTLTERLTQTLCSLYCLPEQSVRLTCVRWLEERYTNIYQ